MKRIRESFASQGMDGLTKEFIETVFKELGFSSLDELESDHTYAFTGLYNHPSYTMFVFMSTVETLVNELCDSLASIIPLRDQPKWAILHDLTIRIKLSPSSKFWADKIEPEIRSTVETFVGEGTEIETSYTNTNIFIDLLVDKRKEFQEKYKEEFRKVCYRPDLLDVPDLSEEDERAIRDAVFRYS